MFNNEDGNGWQWLSIKYIKFSCGSERPCCTTYWKASSPVAPAHPPSPPTEIRRNHRARGPKAMTGQEVTHEAGARHPKTDWGWRIVTLTKTLSKKTVARIIHCRPSSSSDVCPCDLQVRSKPMPSSPHKLSNHQSQVSAMLRILNAILTSDNMEAVTQACDSNNVRPMSLQSCQMLFGLSEHQHLVAVFFTPVHQKTKLDWLAPRHQQLLVGQHAWSFFMRDFCLTRSTTESANQTVNEVMNKQRALKN